MNLIRKGIFLLFEGDWLAEHLAVITSRKQMLIQMRFATGDAHQRGPWQGARSIVTKKRRSGEYHIKSHTIIIIVILQMQSSSFGC